MAAGKTFLVTGAGRDIGQGIARQLAGPGCFGVLHCTRSRAGAEATLDALRSAGGDGIVLQADFSDDDAVGRFLERAMAALQGMLAVNVLASHRIMDALAPRLADGAAIIALSIAAVRQVFSPDFAFFSGTKAATDVLVKGWAVTLGRRGIRVNAVAPGVVDANFRSDLLKDETFRVALEGATALGRPVRIDDIADVVAFLASDKARWITGQVIDASGGWKL